MKKQFFLLFTLVVIPFTLVAQTNISGTISNNTTLTAAGSPYIVTGHLNVNAGVTLTVESGVEMRFNAGIYMVVYGTLNANSATFTANGSTTPGFWPGIYVSYQYNAAFGAVVLNNCVVEYAQSLHLRKGELTLTGNTLINNFSSYGVDLYTDGGLNMDATTIQNCSYPLYFRGNGSWSVGEGVTLTGNATDYIFINFRDIISEFRLPDLGIPYYYDSELRITAAGTLLVDPGVSLQGNTGAHITVYGKFKATGTAGEPILFSNLPSATHWSGLNFYDAAIDTACILTHCKFTGANYTYYNRNYELPYVAVEIIKSSPAFNQCEFSDNRYNLVVTGSSFPSFTDCSFLESNLVAKRTLNINIDLNATPVFNTCSIAFNNSEARAIGIIGSTVYDDAHMKHHSFAGLDSISYALYGQVVIQDTASLVVDPGIVIKCTSYSDYIQANGALNGTGTESSPIVFTHINDDNWGNPGDTHDDGTTSITRSSSGRLIINSQTTSTLAHWKVLYGGYNSSYYSVYLYFGNVLQNCEISESYRGVLFSGDAQLINNSFENITSYPISRRMNEGAPTLIGNTVLNSGHLGIFVHDFMDGTYTIGGLDIGSNANVAYIVDHDTPIPVTADVTILPGTVFKFTSYYGKLSVRGGLLAEGAASNRIIFTSIYDNSASGNTNFNSGADPTGYKWNGIEFFDSSHDNLNSLKNCEVRYVNNSIRMTNCRVVMDSVLLNFSNNYALSIYGSANPEITNCQFNNLASAPIHMDMFANPTFSGNSVANVSLMGISINGGTISGIVPSRSFAGHDSVTYLIFQTLQVDDQLTIPAGITFKGSGSAYFNIFGTLNVEGTAGNPVIFTTLQDDDYGSPADTEQNGVGSIVKHGNRIVMRDLADDNSVIDHALFRYSYDYAIHAASVSPTISNSTFFNTNRCGLYLVGTSAPTVASCIFDDLQYPMITSLMTFPGSHSGNILTGTTAKGIMIVDNETLTQNYTISKRSFAGIDNIPYLFGRYNVGTSAVLTISPGVVCKFWQNGYLNIRNGLIADGGSTPDSAIVFTSDRDDFYGGDTYGDGDANVATDRWWQGIYFLEESIDASCFLDNCIIKNGTYYVASYAHTSNRGAITINNASPTIQNSLFEKNYRAIIVRNTSLPTIENCDFVETNPTYGYGVWNETGTVTVVAENCWWNDLSGPYHATLNPDGLGEKVSDNVDFTPWISQTAKPILGDVSLNGEVMPYDASLVLQHTVGNITLDAKQITVADVTDDGSISSFDASLILQYAIGLITNFDQPGKKSAGKSGFALNDLTVSAPSYHEAPTGARFEIPLSFSTPAFVKSIDMQLSTDKQHLKFIGLSSEHLPPDIMVASGYQEHTGVLKISLTSAYDLDLNMDELGIVFEVKASQCEASEIQLVSLTANETACDGSLFTVRVESQNGTTGVQPASGLSSLKIYSVDEMLVAELYLASEQSKLNLSVYDMAGRITNQMTIENPDRGQNRFSFSAEAYGQHKPSGIYLVTIRGDDFVVTRKLVL